jgi:hypothetical protein
MKPKLWYIRRIDTGEYYSFVEWTSKSRALQIKDKKIHDILKSLRKYYQVTFEQVK